MRTAQTFEISMVFVILLLPLVVTVTAVVDLLLGGSGAAWGEEVREFGVTPLAILPALFFAALPPLLEELGWRGYALDRLKLNWPALSASLILGGTREQVTVDSGRRQRVRHTRSRQQRGFRQRRLRMRVRFAQ